MAFVSMIFVYLVIVLIVIFFFTTLGIVLILVGFFMKRHYKKDPENRKKWYLIPKILSVFCMLPLIGTVGLVAFAFISTGIKNHYSLSYNVMRGDFKATERLLKNGVCPDCTLDSNDPAENGEQTLLSIICEQGFTDSTGHVLSEHDEEVELEMIELLLEYGADTEAVHYYHEKTDPIHSYQDEKSIYCANDTCGATPLLDAVYAGKYDVVRVLLDHGADVNAKDFSGYNALNYVAEFRYDSDMELVHLLMERGCDP